MGSEPRLRTLAVFIMVLLFGAGAVAALPPHDPGGTPPSQVVPGRYIVVLHDHVPSAAAVARDLAASHGLAVFHVYEAALKGFAADVPPGRLLALQLDPRVAHVEPDQTVYAFAQSIPTGVLRIFALGNPTLAVDGTDDVRVDVDVAIIDSGIATHDDLNIAGRTDCAGGGPFSQSCTDGAGTDGNGHGTHVAGTVAALDNGIGVVGVAPGARLWSVRVLGNSGSGYMSWIIAGIDWVTTRASQIEVANMSLGCECSSGALDTAIANSVAAGVVYVVAAGNNDKDAATFSPANHPDVIAVSALADFNGLENGGAAPTCRADQDDTLADFSNWGSKVKLAAPGVCIRSTWKDGGYNTISGTSMAAPHVTGAAALLASGTGKPTSKSGVMAIRDKLMTSGNLNWIDDSGDGIKERLLDVGDATVFAPALVPGSAGTTDDPPTVAVTSPANGATVSGAIAVQASATDDHGVTQVQFLVDGISLGTDTNGGDGWSVTWDTTTATSAAHTVTATATDSNGQTASHGISVTVANSTPSESGGDASRMGVYSIGWSSSKQHLDVTVNIRRDDADPSGALSSGDAVVSGAAVTFTITRDTNKNGSFECGAGDECWTFAGNTDSSGNYRGRVLHAPAGRYRTQVTGVTASTLSWDATLDRENPEEFTR